MVFKGRFFSSRKADSSSTDGSNSPRTPTLDSPKRFDKKKIKHPHKDDFADSASPSPSPSPSSARRGGGDESGGGGGGGSSGARAALQHRLQAKKKEKEREIKGKDGQGPAFSAATVSSSRNRKAGKSGGGAGGVEEAAPADPPAAAPAPAMSPVVASALGLHRIKTRSGPLPQGSVYGLRGETSKGSAHGASNLSKGPFDDGPAPSSSSLGKNAVVGRKEAHVLSKKIGKDRGSGWVDSVSNSDSMSVDSGGSRGRGPLVQSAVKSAGVESSHRGQNSMSNVSEEYQSADAQNPQTQAIYDGCETPKESESPRFKAIMRVTSAPRKRFPGDIKSFSHELDSKGVKPYPFWKPRGLNNLEGVLVQIRTKFDKAKEEVDSDLAIFAADLIGILEKNVEAHPEWQETMEDLLVLARRCAVMSSGEFWVQCEGIVQVLDDKRQEVPMGLLKQLHTRMLFILTRCTRLVQFHKETGFADDEPLIALRQSMVMHSAQKPILTGDSSGVLKNKKADSSKKSYSQDLQGLSVKREHPIQQFTYASPADTEGGKNTDSSGNRNQMSSWRKFPSPAEKNQRDALSPKEDFFDGKNVHHKRGGSLEAIKRTDVTHAKDATLHTSAALRHQRKSSWGHWGDQESSLDENFIICRICEDEVPTSHVEEHSRICAIADRCDQKGLSVNERLIRIAETLEKIVESYSKDLPNAALGSPDVGKVSNSSMTEESDGLSPKLSDWSRRGSEDMLDCLPEGEGSTFVDDLKGLPAMSCRTRFGPKSDQGMATSSAGSMTPRSPLLTPKTSHIDLLLAGKVSFAEHDDIPQIIVLADIARSASNVPVVDYQSAPYLLVCTEDLQLALSRRKLDALTVETFGARIEKLLQEKYLQLCELVYDEKVDLSSTVIYEDGPLEDDVVRSLRSSPVHPSKDRTSIDDFEIIKPISRGAFGRVFLAKKRTTGDLFAIKVLKKADMIRKNAVESILAERDILISVRNHFVVRFFYSFTCQENLYLVMEYLNGGDLYSLLRNLGCLDEEIARIYIAEVVLALEYLHSVRIVHRDLKPDNLLIAHDGHIKLTDFGLSKVGLINSTDDLSGPAVSGTSMLEEDQPSLSVFEQRNQRERRRKCSAVGTPDYLAPEILLGTGHGATADWWSVGVILFELIVGIPPFNAEHPQSIFDNILNRKIPWPRVPEEMSPEAYDLIDRLMAEDPSERLGANGASEVKEHTFFKDINWDTLARQKAAFIPASDNAYDTSYFTSRYSWNPSDEHFYAASDFEDSSDVDSMSDSSSCVSNRPDELGDECGGLAEFDSNSSVNYSFSNFSFKNLSQLASINYDLLTKGKDEPPSKLDGS